MNSNTVKAFRIDLQALTQLVAELGGHAERQIAEAMESLTRRDRSRAQQVVRSDSILDGLQLDIETRCVATMATRQPMGAELRQIFGVLRIATELERVGDLAKNIAKRAAALNQQDLPPQILRGMRHMASLVLSQLREGLDSFMQKDAAAARLVRDRDDEIDAIYRSLFREMLAYMTQDPGAIGYCVHLLFCAKNLERVGDHTTSIAEAVGYIVDGCTFSGAPADGTARTTPTFQLGAVTA
jgi:phosphate transport system protein